MIQHSKIVLSVMVIFWSAYALDVAAAPPQLAPVEVTDQTVRMPAQGRFSVRYEMDERGSNIELIAPPEGMMAVIQYITIRSFPRREEANPSLQLTGAVGSEFVTHYLGPLPEPVPFPVVSQFAQITQQHVLLYSTEPVILSIDRGDQTEATADFNVSFSGYLVDAPATP